MLCWLGKDDYIVAEDCFRMICDTARAMEQEFHPGWTVSNPFNDSKLKGLPKTAENWRFVAQFFDLTWFHRVWQVVFLWPWSLEG